MLHTYNGMFAHEKQAFCKKNFHGFSEGGPTRAQQWEFSFRDSNALIDAINRCLFTGKTRKMLPVSSITWGCFWPFALWMDREFLKKKLDFLRYDVHFLQKRTWVLPRIYHFAGVIYNIQKFLNNFAWAFVL